VPNINNYIGGEAIDEAPRAVTAWGRIQEKPSTITVRRETGAMVAAQTVRVEYGAFGSEVDSATGKASDRGLIVFGIKGHPTLPDTDIERGDKFMLDGVQFRVVDLVLTLGSIQAYARVMS
jgi:hypothetical protein